MSGDDESAWGYVEGVSDERILGVFRDADPLSTGEIASAAKVSDQTAAAKLTELAGKQQVRRKTVDEDRSVWFRPVSAFGPSDERTERSLSSAIDDLEVPGTSRMMRDWRRDAVRAAFDYLAANGPVKEPSFREDVYPAQSAGYDDPEPWWAMVRPRLKTLPGVDAPTWRSETTWRFEDDVVAIDDQ